MSHSLIFPMTAHVVLAALLYALLTVARAPAVWGIGRLTDGGSPWAKLEPRIGANLSNQFEWPLFFHLACVLLLQSGTGESFDPAVPSRAGELALTLAWVFVGGRMLHSVVQIAIANVRLRGLAFTVNFVAVLGLWGIVVARAVT